MDQIQLPEPLLNAEHFRYTVKPINPQYKIFWDIYKKQQSCYWTAEEVDFSKDYHDFITLSADEQIPIKHILAFFAASDGIVVTNLKERFQREIMVSEVQIAYGFQLMMENIHGEIYSDMLNNIIKDTQERTHLFNAITTIPAVKKMADWSIKWINSDASFGQRIIAFAIVEGIFFSGAFATIFWLKNQRSNGKLFMNGLIQSNKFIARDEGIHVNFACVLYSYVVNRIPELQVSQMFTEAVEICKNFTNESMRCDLIGMNNKLMNQYIEYVADRLIVYLGYTKIYNSTNPFDFMENIGLLSKANFFETRPDDYQKSNNGENNASWDFKIMDEF